MMDMFDHLALGFSVALSFNNLFYCFLGVLIGTLIGVLPGIGPVTTIALLMPITFVLSPVSALIMLAGIYYGAQYGGSTTAILVNLPGEASSVVTTLDGYQMALQGRAGEALAIAAIGSFFAGCVATLLIAATGPLLSSIALEFGPAEYFALMCFGLVGSIVMASGSVLKAVAMIFLGLALGLVGTDVNSGDARFTFGMVELSDGIGFVPVAMGLFGVAEILRNLRSNDSKREIVSDRISGLWPGLSTLAKAFPAMMRGTAVGSVLGLLPGGGATLSSFVSYVLEKKTAKDPSRFGHGALEGVAGPESANNAGAQTSFVPMLVLGIPSNAVMALMAGAMMVHGIAPGPQVMTANPSLFWGIIASMWIGNLMLLVINLPLIGIWVSLLKIPYRMMFPAIIVFCSIGGYSIDNSTFALVLIAIFGLLGYLLMEFDFEPAPLLLGFVLGPLMEENLRRAMLLSRGDPMTFVESPISLFFMAGAAILLLIVLIPSIGRSRKTVFVED